MQARAATLAEYLYLETFWGNYGTRHPFRIGKRPHAPAGRGMRKYQLVRGFYTRSPTQFITSRLLRTQNNITIIYYSKTFPCRFDVKNNTIILHSNTANPICSIGLKGRLEYWINFFAALQWREGLSCTSDRVFV